MSKNTIKCDRCDTGINPKKDKSYCFHQEGFGGDEVYICAKCVAEVYNEFVEDMDGFVEDVDEG